MPRRTALLVWACAVLVTGIVSATRSHAGQERVAAGAAVNALGTTSTTQSAVAADPSTTIVTSPPTSAATSASASTTVGTSTTAVVGPPPSSGEVASPDGPTITTSPPATSSSPVSAPVDVPPPPSIPIVVAPSPPPRDDPAVTGRVVNTLGLPVLDAHLCVYAFGMTVPKTPVALDGSFTFDTLGDESPMGSWVLVAQGCDDPMHVPYDSAGVQLRPGDLPAKVTIVALRKNAIFGTVIDEVGAPIPNVCIVMTSDDPSAPFIPPFTNRSDGGYGPFEGLPQVSYTFEVHDGSCNGPVLEPIAPGSNNVSLGYAPLRVDIGVKRPS